MLNTVRGFHLDMQQQDKQSVFMCIRAEDLPEAPLRVEMVCDEWFDKEMTCDCTKSQAMLNS